MLTASPYRTAALTPPARRTLRQRFCRWFALHVLSPEWQAHRREAGGRWTAWSWCTDVNHRVTAAWDWYRASPPHWADDDGPMRVEEDWPEAGA